MTVRLVLRRASRWRAGLAIAVLALSVFAAAGCGSSSDSSQAATTAATTASGAAGPGAGKTIGVVSIGTNQYTQCMATGAIKELSSAGYKVIGFDSKFDAKQEVANFDQAIARKVDGILVLPVTPQSAARGAIAAQKANIPVVNLAWATPAAADDIYVGRVRLDNVQGGKLITDWLKDNATPGEVVIVSGVPGNEFSDDFDRGVTEGIKALGGDWKVVGNEPGFYVRDKAITAVENLTAAHPNAKVIITSVAEMGVGVASWLERSGRKDVVHVTSDGNLEMAAWMKKGDITADRYFSSALNGELGGQLLRTYLEDGKKTTEPVDVTSTMVTADGIAAAEKKEPLCYQQYLPQVKDFS